MKVILNKDVPKLGDAGSIQTVKDGFARNYLIPQGLASEATPGRLKNAEQRLRAIQRKVEREEEAQKSLAERLNGLRIAMTARVGEQGRLYGSITSADVAEKISAAVGQEIDRRKVLLDEPIRSVGEHQVTVHLVGRLRPVVTVAVAGEQVDEPAAEAPAEEAPEAETDDVSEEA
ncbi:MAG TPA: 50S ribosomal protein L9 [Nitrolancea sp.]|nr:50S ribosomal protein L9 [Nitrolancea sp.]